MESATGPTEHAPAANVPLTPAQQRQYALVVAGVSLVLFAFGYLIGHSGGANVDAARAAGESAGIAVGTKQGQKAGYAAGFTKGYRTSYKAAYSKAKGN